MTLADALGLRRGDVLALVGAGGKTTLSALLGLKLLARGVPVACCATAATLLPAHDPRVRTVLTADEDPAEAVRAALQAGQLPWVAGASSAMRDPAPQARGGVACPIPFTDAKAEGMRPAEVDRLHAAMPDLTLIVEADGAKHRWLKAPAHYEPPLPASVTVLSPMAHLGVVGQPLIEQFVHRPELVAQVLGKNIGDTLNEEDVARVLLHPNGGLKGWHPGIRLIPVLTLPSPDINAEPVARVLLRAPVVSHVVLAWLGENPWAKAIHRPAGHSERSRESPSPSPCHSSLRSESPGRTNETPRLAQGDSEREPHIVGILLAAGESARLGTPKQLLPFGGKSLVEHALGILLASSVNEVIVIVGAHAEAITPLVQRPRVRVVHNPHWQRGLSTSVRAALMALPAQAEAAVFVPCDMPRLTSDVIETLIAAWRETQKPIVTAASGRTRGIPALFAREMFQELQGIDGDEGGRALIRAHPHRVAAVEVPPDALADIDTPAQYREALRTLTAHRQGESMHRLKPIRNLIVDMDGVLYRGEQPIPGVADFFRFLSDHNIRYLCATNNSTLTPEQYTEKLARMGVQVPPQQILTSSVATVEYLSAKYPPGTRVFAVGETGLIEAFKASHFVLDDRDASLVVVGLDRHMTYEKLARATLLIRAGAQFIGTNPDKTLPVPEGQIPGAGSLLALLETATSVQPTVIGKPEKHLYQIALARLRGSTEDTAAVGDRLETDILGASRTGLFSILVLSGISTEEEALACPNPPDLIFEDVGALARHWADVLNHRGA